MTKDEQATLEGVSAKLDRLIDLMSNFVGLQAQVTQPPGADSGAVLEDGRRLTLQEELLIDQTVTQQVQAIQGRGLPVGQVDQLIATRRREYLRELQDRGGVIVIRSN